MLRNVEMFTDLYEFTMAQCYFLTTENPKATFELFVRRLPRERGYLISAGLEDVCKFLSNFKFSRDDINYLGEKGFDEDFLKFLKGLRFTSSMWAMEEGELVFPNEPILRLTGPITELQLLETFLLNAVNFQSLVATKASRVVMAARGKPVVDFGSRRAQGVDAGLKAARASYLAGCAGTSNVLAGKVYGIPVFGTMAHSFVQAFPSEKEAFKKWLSVWGSETVLLIDTYDTIRGARNAIEATVEVTGKRYLRGVRIDSGDVVKISRDVRSVLDENGFKKTKIFVSGGLNEYEVERLLKKGAAVDAFGVGTDMVTSSDAPYLDICYKLVEVEENGKLVPKMKFAEGEKKTLPGAKEVFRVEKGGKFVKDILGLAEESIEGNRMLKKVFDRGKLVYKMPSIEDVRERVKENMRKLPEKYKKIRNPSRYRVEISKRLLKLERELMLANRSRAKPIF